MITLRSEREISCIRKSCQIVARILDEVVKKVEPGISTAELDHFTASRCKDFQVKPAFKGYHGFPATLCVSINDEVVHGIPSPKKIIKIGDIVGVDFGISLDGWYGDSARTVMVGTVGQTAQKLVEATQKSLQLGILECREGNHLFDIGYAIQNYVEAFGYGVVREFVGHGIGRALHEEPQVPNFGAKGKGIPLKIGMVLAIEPMINAGSHRVRVLDDGWTAVTEDHSLSAHFEHTVAITSNGPEILTAM